MPKFRKKNISRAEPLEVKKENKEEIIEKIEVINNNDKFDESETKSIEVLDILYNQNEQESDAAQVNDEEKVQVDTEEADTAMKIVEDEFMQNIISESDNQQVKIIKLGVKKEEVKVNKFDLFCIKIWTILVSVINTSADGINSFINLIFKRKLPAKYIRAFIATVLIILTILLVSLPFSIKVENEPQVEVFSSNMIPVKVHTGNDESGYPIYQWGYAKKNGVMALEAKYYEALPFKYNVAWVCVVEERNIANRFWQLIDTKGRVKGSGKNANQKFYYNNQLQGRPIGEFTDNKLAWVNIGGMYGYINTKGNISISTKYSYAENFSEGLAKVRLASNEFFIDGKDNTVGQYYEQVKAFSEGLGAVKKNDLWGFMDKKGKIIIKAEYDDVSPFYGGYAIVRRNVTYGIIDAKGKFVIEPHLFIDFCASNKQLREYVDMMMEKYEMQVN